MNGRRSKHNDRFIGGTGLQGTGLAMRLAIAGYAVLIGSRTAERAQDAAAAVQAVASNAVSKASTTPRQPHAPTWW